MSKRTRVLLFGVTVLLGAVWWNPSATRPGPAPESRIDRPVHPLLYANHPAPTDSVMERQALRRVEQLYRAQADFLAVQARRDAGQATRLLDREVRDLQWFARQPGLTSHPRFRHAFEAITAECRERYGVPDTLVLPLGDIYDLRRDLLPSLDDASVSLPETVPLNDLWLANADVPMTINERVTKSMSFLLRGRDAHLYPWLPRSATYFPMIEQIFAEENVPDERKYLALVQSGLNPRAQKCARAAGIRQFVAQTGRSYGLTIDPWVDERRDPEKAIRAVARRLRDLYGLFGDWQLALAGYNCSPCLIRRAVLKARRRLHREPTFWDIYPGLSEVTRNDLVLQAASPPSSLQHVGQPAETVGHTAERSHVDRPLLLRTNGKRCSPKAGGTGLRRRWRESEFLCTPAELFR